MTEKTLKLPTTMPDGKKTRKHPLLWCLEERLGDRTKSDAARMMGVKPQSLYKWERLCREDRNFPLPLLRAMQLGKFFGVPHTLFRPDASWSA